MVVGHFYFLKSDYLQKLPNSMNNREHNRPYFCAIAENNIFWVVPITSKIDKFEEIYEAKLKRYGKCDTIDFCQVLGHSKAFLIQNMCPITEKHILNEYLDPHDNPVQICDKSRKRIIHKAKKVLALQRKGIDLLFGDVLTIEKSLQK